MKPSSDWDIYLTARNEKLGLEAVKEFADKGLTVKFHQLDITDPESRKRLAQFLADTYPEGIHILVNNAGVLLDVSVSTIFYNRMLIRTNLHRFTISAALFAI